MGLRTLEAGEPVPAGDAQVAVCIPLYGAHDHFTRCLYSVLRHTPRGVPILIADDASPDPTSHAWLAELDDAGVIRHRLLYLRQPVNLGFASNVNAAFRALSPADVAVVNSDCVVAEGWLEGLVDAAYTESNVATASTLSNCGEIVSVPLRNRPAPSLPQNITLEEAAARVRATSSRMRPRLPTAIGHCMLVRRSALDLVGGFDETFNPAYGEEVDFSQRCLVRGLVHVLADDVLVLHHGGASLEAERVGKPMRDEHEEILRERYPHYHPLVHEVSGARTGPLAHSLMSAARAVRGLSVTIDGRCLFGVLNGTQVVTLEDIRALKRAGLDRLRVMLPASPDQYALDQIGDVETCRLGEAIDPTSVVHRTYQVTSAEDLTVLRDAGERVVISWLDLIAYRNPGYFENPEEYRRYRRLTRLSLALADHAVFLSGTARDDALAEQLIDVERLSVVPVGVPQGREDLQPLATPPARWRELEARPYLLCLGTDYRHKNRVFALKVFEALRRRHGWEGRLVFAGQRVPFGSSAGDEASWLAARPDVAGDVIPLATLDEPEKIWLFEHAAAVVYPTVYEGFGLVPFEAAAAGVPPLFAWETSLREMLPRSAATLVAWDADASADRCIEALRDGARRESLVREISAAAKRYSWDRRAQRLIEIYERVLHAPGREASQLAGDTLEVEQAIDVATRERAAWERASEEADARYWELWDAIGPTGRSLVGPEGKLPERSQRALSALTRRPATRTALVGTLGGLHRLAGRLGRRAGPGQRPVEEPEVKPPPEPGVPMRTLPEPSDNGRPEGVTADSPAEPVREPRAG